MFAVSKELEKQLAEIDPAVLFELEQLIAAKPPAARAVVENALEQPLPPNLPKPLVPQDFVAKPPPSQKEKTGSFCGSLTLCSHKTNPQQANETWF